MGTKQYDSATDILTFSRASGGTALRKISYGNNLVTNGTFDTDLSGWNAESSWTYSNGKAALLANSEPNQSLSSTKAYVKVGKTYRVRFDASTSVGTPVNTSMKLRIWGNDNGTGTFIYNGSYINTGSNELLISPTANGYMAFDNVISNSFDKFIDNVSIEEVLFDQADGTLQLWNHANNIPRIEYDATGAVKGLLIEEARTNVATYSNDFGNLAPGLKWLSNGITVTPNSAISPDGTTNATKFDMASNGFTRKLTGHVPTVGQTYTFSVWIKAGTASEVKTAILFNGSGLGYTQLTHTLTNEWQRFTVTSTLASGTPDQVRARFVATQAGTIFVYGAQVELGSFHTSYIPTTGATATRARDLAEIPTSAFGYNNDQGSLVIDVLTPVADQFMALGYFNTSSFYNSRGFFKSNANNSSLGPHYMLAAYDGSSTKLVLGQQTQAEYTKLGLSYGNNEKAVRGGGNIISGTSSYPTSTRLHLGGRDNGFQSQCWIKSIQYYPRQLTDTQLQELTT